MVIRLETAVAGEKGKAWIRERFSSHTNYPLVCENKDCHAQLGILHTDPISESAYFVDGVDWAKKGSSILCPECQTEHDLERYASDSPGVAPERYMPLEELQKKLREEAQD